MVRSTPPSDLRPAFRADLERIWYAARELFNEEYDFLVPRDQVVLLNKIPYPDAGDEVIVSGYIVAHVFFDLKLFRWRFKPMYAGVHRMIEEEIGYYALVDLPKLARGFIVHKGNIIKSHLPERKGVYVALKTINGKFYALGERLPGSRIKVIKSWRRRSYNLSSRASTWDEAVRCNRDYINWLEREAIDFIKDLSRKGFEGIYVSFSGGKDSLASYLITEKALGGVPILFNDTGIEMPETVEYVSMFAERTGVELISADAGDRFWAGLEVFGPPARDYRWCCKIVKLAPIIRAFREKYGLSKVLSIVGQRRYESFARFRSPRVWRNRWIPSLLSASPINDWTALDVWLYLFLNRATVNPLYEAGFDRLGCFLCPACEVAEFEAVRKLHPELWEKWERVLSSYALGRGLGDKWVRYGLWRWRRIPGDISRELRINNRLMGYDRGVRVTLSKVEEREGCSTYRFRINSDRLSYAFLPMLGRATIDGDFLRIDRRDASIVIDLRDRRYTVCSSETDELAIDVLRLIVRSTLCISCGLCTNWCPSGALRIDDRGLIFNSDKCTGCLICNKYCPICKFLEIKLDKNMEKVNQI